MTKKQNRPEYYLTQKWVKEVIVFISKNKKVRFSELERNIPRISPRTLSMRLKSLEENGIVTRKVFPVVPPHVEYSITKKGEGANSTLQALYAI